MGKKKPDLVVWSEEKGYYPRELTYGSNLGAPAIKLDDIKGWKQNQVGQVNNHFGVRFEELKAQFNQMLEEVYWNERVYESEYSFIPVIGDIYHLYKRDNNTTFLSMVEPSSWNKEHIGSFKLDSNKKWNKI